MFDFSGRLAAGLARGRGLFNASEQTWDAADHNARSKWIKKAGYKEDNGMVARPWNQLSPDAKKALGEMQNAKPSEAEMWEGASIGAIETLVEKLHLDRKIRDMYRWSMVPEEDKKEIRQYLHTLDWNKENSLKNLDDGGELEAITEGVENAEPGECAMCGEHSNDRKLINVDGEPTMICEQCHGVAAKFKLQNAKGVLRGSARYGTLNK